MDNVDEQSNQTPLVFVHGWGASTEFWDGLATGLNKNESNRIDLDFFGVTDKSNEHSLQKSVFITHSLGTLWTLKNQAQEIDKLIIINGFYDFMEFSNPRTLRAMKARLQKEPLNQMHDFWDMMQMPIPQNYEQKINTKRLIEGLGWLENWEAKDALDALKTDILILAGQNDPLLPIEKMKVHWQGYNLQICEGGGHALPVTNSQWCADKIETFI